MKKCAYCGRENQEGATRCRECGTELIAEQTPEKLPSNDGERLQRTAVVDNEVQAGLLDAILTERGVPHIMQTYRDSAYDGIFQTQKGWGAILAPARFSDEIATVLEEIKRESQA